MSGHTIPVIETPIRTAKSGAGWASKFASHTLALPGRIDIASWHNKTAPERRWIVDGIIPEGNVTMLGGDGGMGKSILALQLIVACALGKPWLGMQTRPCKVVGIFCEDDQDEIWRRIEKIAAHYGAVPSDLFEYVTLFSRVGMDNALVEWRDSFAAGEATDLFAAVSNVAVDSGAELVVLDSLHDVFVGNENSRPHARQFISELRGLAIHIRGGVLITAHPSLSGRNTGTGEAGSTAWNNAVRSRLYLTAPQNDPGDDEAGDYRELKTMKANYGAAGGRIRLRWQDGVFVVEHDGTGMVAAIERDNAERAFLDCLDAILNQGRTVSDASQATNYAPRVFLTLPQANGTKQPALTSAMGRLFASGAIKIGPCGQTTSRHPRQGIIRTPSNPAKEATP